MNFLEKWAYLLNIKKEPVRIKPSHDAKIKSGTHKEWQGKLGIEKDGIWGSGSSSKAIRDFCKLHGICHIRVNRYKSDKDATLGEITLFFPEKDEYIYACDSLEDPHREKKVYGKTRIWAGTYTVGLRTVGGMAGRYRSKFPLIHKGMLWVRFVNDFEYIYFHIGNKPKDTLGCILVGTANNRLMRVYKSVIAYKRFYVAVLPYVKKGKCVATFEDNDK